MGDACLHEHLAFSGKACALIEGQGLDLRVEPRRGRVSLHCDGNEDVQELTPHPAAAPPCDYGHAADVTIHLYASGADGCSA
jgi:hypothetical protein